MPGKACWECDCTHCASTNSPETLGGMPLMQSAYRLRHAMALMLLQCFVDVRDMTHGCRPSSSVG